MEFQIKLSWVARLQLMDIMNKMLKGTGLDPEYVTACELYEKVYISDEEQMALSVKQPNGTRTLDTEKLLKVKDHEVSLNYKEMTKFEKVMTECELKPMDRKLWWANVMAQLEEAKKPELQDKPTRDRQLADIRSGSRK